MATDNQGPTIIGVTMMFWGFALIALCLRFWCLQVKKRSVSAHDLWILIGFACATALTVCLIVSVELGGLGQHAVDLAKTPWKLTTFGKLLIVIQILWCFSMTCIRLSILRLYISLFSINKVFRTACYIMMTVCLLWAAGEVLVVFLLCRPFAYNWDKAINGSCGNLNAAYLIVHGSNFVIDSSIALLPTPVLWRLKIPRVEKLAIMLMFALGALICSIAIARIALYRLALAYDQSDFTYSGSTLYLFTSIEPLLGCSLACMPLLQPVADMAAAFPFVTWARSWAQTRTSKSLTDKSRYTGHDGYLPTESQEGLHHAVHVSAGGLKTGGPGMERENGGRGICVNRQFEHRSLEMDQRPSGR